MRSLEDFLDEVLAAAALDEVAFDTTLREIFLTLKAEFTEALGGLFQSVASGAIESAAAETSSYDLLIDAHSRGAYLGRTMAGSVEDWGDLDLVYGQLIADEQFPYAQGFLDDILSGKYTNADGTFDLEAIQNRANLYDRRLRGTANESFVNSLDLEDLVYWLLGATENHCGTCEDLKNNSPYKPNELPTYPGDGATECSIGCDCTVKSESGKVGF